VKKSRLKDRFASKRARFPDDEPKLTWLPMLLDAYALIDRGIEVAVDREQKKRGVRLACGKGCSNCCRAHTDIPVYPHELLGIYWFATEKICGNKRDALRKQLTGHGDGPPCPFLVEGECAIHVIRPAACRQFNVFGRACDEGEDPYHSRRQDVLTPIQDFTDRAFAATIPFYGIEGGSDRTMAAREIIHTRASNLHSCDWEKLLRLMEGFDSRHA
jgi:Fe-S-cluster containining protein